MSLRGAVATRQSQCTKRLFARASRLLRQKLPRNDADGCDTLLKGILFHVKQFLRYPNDTVCPQNQYGRTQDRQGFLLLLRYFLGQQYSKCVRHSCRDCVQFFVLHPERWWLVLKRTRLFLAHIYGRDYLSARDILLNTGQRIRHSYEKKKVVLVHNLCECRP